jgi:hypothetical protein
VLHAGSFITLSCDYQNDRDRFYVFGNSAKSSEMCLLHGMYWPRMSSAGEPCFGGFSSGSRL